MKRQPQTRWIVRQQQKVKATLRSYNQQHCNDYGFVIPVTVGMGLVMLLVGMTMVARSNTDQSIASAQKLSGQSLATAEGGVNRVLSLLNLPDNAYLLGHPALTPYGYDPINSNTHKTYLGADQIQNNGDEEISAVDTWSTPPPEGGCRQTARPLPADLLTGSIGASDSLTEKYEVKAYRFNPTTKTGALLVEGTLEDAENSPRSASRVVVKVQVRQKVQSRTFPGLYGSRDINLDNNDVLKVIGDNGASANVICKDCVVNDPVNDCTYGRPTQNGARGAINANANGFVDGGVYLGNPKLPPVPTPPADTICSSNVECQINLGTTLDPRAIPSLPRAQDTANHKAGTPYHYVVDNIDLDSRVLTINTTSDPVRLYVRGNIILNGNGGIRHTGEPGRLAIFGRPADRDDRNDQIFVLSGGAQSTNLFIYAPDAITGINGGSSDPDILGAVWVKRWDASASNNAEIRVPDRMPNLLGKVFGDYFKDVGVQVNATTSTEWLRVEAK